jgi:hypothetical protein
VADDPVLQSLRRKVVAGDVRGIRIQVRVSGGMPAEQHVDRTVTVDAAGQAVMSAAEQDPSRPVQTTTQLPQKDLSRLLSQFGEGAAGLVPRAQARFLPDSVVGSVLVEVDGETTELFYLADEQDRITQDKPISAAAAEALGQLQALGGGLPGPSRGGS